MSNRIFILQKDWIFCWINNFIPKGEEFESFEGKGYASKKYGQYFSKDVVENNPEWFLEKKEENSRCTLIRASSKTNGGIKIEADIVGSITSTQIGNIKKAIEDVLNEQRFIGEDFEVFFRCDGRVVPKTFKIFTEKELLEAEKKAFDAARKTFMVPVYTDEQSSQYCINGPQAAKEVIMYKDFSDFKNNSNQ